MVRYKITKNWGKYKGYSGQEVHIVQNHTQSSQITVETSISKKRWVVDEEDLMDTGTMYHMDNKY